MASLLAVLFAAMLPLQPHPDAAENDANAKKPAANEGIWPTPKMLEGMLVHWADESAVKLDLSDEQTERLEEQLLKRWPAFLEEHRETLQPLLNEYIETHMAKTPPEREAIKSWADRAMPMFELFQEQILESQRDMTEYLEPAQKGKLAAESLKMTAGLQLFQAKIKSWQRGEFEERDWWDPPRRVLNQRERDKDAAEAAAAAAAPSLAKKRVEEELSRWDRHVAEVIEKFKLDDTQRVAAESILRECKERATAHLDRYRARMEQLEKRLKDGAAEQAEVAEMYAPFDAMFAELKSRVEQIPTTAQMAAAPKSASAPQPQAAPPQSP